MIRVLIVDDSAVMRAFLSRVVSAQPDMEVVAVAADPVVAIEQIRLKSPDVMTLDVEMPRMNGLDFLRKLMAVRPLPVIMISSLTRQGAETTMQALELGAVDFVQKPADVSQFEASVERHRRQDPRGELGAGGAAPPPRGRRRQRPARAADRTRPARATLDRVIAIGASTGGVEAVREILAALPTGMPPILIAQHMPAGYTETFARRLDSICRDRGEAGAGRRARAQRRRLHRARRAAPHLGAAAVLVLAAR